SKILKRETGLSFIDFLTRLRIRKAIQLMGNPREKIYEVAEKVGYSDQHYFSTAFKKVKGVSPAEYRRARGSGG
ncbi:MAG TPA: DNA-binding response regulator, partial [Ruminococcaceae bacterium]|nr:DNA-binding response regulator [Oscillospiraceae bacterium]